MRANRVPKYLSIENFFANFSMLASDDKSAKNISRISSILLSLLVASPATARTFYVSPNGRDTNAGDSSTPFKTIQNAVYSAKAGDTVSLQGGTYYERLIQFTNSGTASNPITVKANSGSKVVIDHGLQVQSWSLDNGCVYKGTPIFPNPTKDNPNNTKRVVVDGKSLIAVGSKSQLKEGNFWVDPKIGTIYLWAFGGINPGTKEVEVINWSEQYKPGIELFNNANYITLDGFTDRAAETAVWAANFSGTSLNKGIVIKNCNLEYAWSYALRFDNWDGGMMDHCNVHDNGQSNIPRGGSDNWPQVIIGFNSQNIKISNSKIHDNNGEGVGPYLDCKKWEISNNTVYDNWSVNVYIDTNEGDVIVNNNYIYNTGKYKGQGRDYSDGIRIANEKADLLGSTNMDGIYNITVTNNKIVNTGGGIRFFPYNNGPSFLQDSLIANNSVSHMQNGIDAIYIGKQSNVEVKNNHISP